MSGKHVREAVEAVDRVWREGGKPFKGRAFEGGRKGFAKNDIMGSVEGDVGDVDIELFIGVDFIVGDEVGERVTALGLVRWERVRRDGMVDESGKGGGEVVRRDMGSREVVRVVGWDMSGV